MGPHSRAELVVLAGEVAGRWSTETLTFLSKLPKAKSRDRPRLLRRRAEQAWRMRWCAVLSCGSCSCFALHRERITYFVLSTPNRVSISRCVTTQESEGASNSCCTSQCPTKYGKLATLQFSSGGLGLRNAERLCPTAYWGSWADTLPVVRRRHPGIADHLMLSLLRNTGVPFGGSK